jgi:hypothetical protein
MMIADSGGAALPRKGCGAFRYLGPAMRPAALPHKGG